MKHLQALGTDGEEELMRARKSIFQKNNWTKMFTAFPKKLANSYEKLWYKRPANYRADLGKR